MFILPKPFSAQNKTKKPKTRTLKARVLFFDSVFKVLHGNMGDFVTDKLWFIGEFKFAKTSPYRVGVGFPDPNKNTSMNGYLGTGNPSPTQ